MRILTISVVFVVLAVMTVDGHGHVHGLLKKISHAVTSGVRRTHDRIHKGFKHHLDEHQKHKVEHHGHGHHVHPGHPEHLVAIQESHGHDKYPIIKGHLEHYGHHNLGYGHGYKDYHVDYPASYGHSEHHHDKHPILKAYHEHHDKYPILQAYHEHHDQYPIIKAHHEPHIEHHGHHSVGHGHKDYHIDYPTGYGHGGHHDQAKYEFNYPKSDGFKQQWNSKDSDKFKSVSSHDHQVHIKHEHDAGHGKYSKHHGHDDGHHEHASSYIVVKQYTNH